MTTEEFRELRKIALRRILNRRIKDNPRVLYTEKNNEKFAENLESAIEKEIIKIKEENKTT
jgi:hypothetical protein